MQSFKVEFSPCVRPFEASSTETQMQKLYYAKILLCKRNCANERTDRVTRTITAQVITSCTEMSNYTTIAAGQQSSNLISRQLVLELVQ